MSPKPDHGEKTYQGHGRLEGRRATMPDDKVQNFGGNTVFGRPAHPAELAPVFVFLASDEASYVAGETYGVTGGRMPISAR